MDDLTKLQAIFKDGKLLKQALTHKSWVNENLGERSSNERLEFLGDAVLEFIISDEIFKQFPDKEEGYLTALRSNLVNTENLATVAEKLNIGDSLFLSKGEEDSGGRTNKSLLANTVEAIIGALFVDQGLKYASEFVKDNIVTEIPDKIIKPLKDPKSRLQEYVQSLSFPTPNYRVTEETGPDHSKKFLIEVYVNGDSWGKGEGKSKSLAEQDAAKAALESHLEK
jgi:ribonuclease-3